MCEMQLEEDNSVYKTKSTQLVDVLKLDSPSKWATHHRFDAI